MKLTRFPFLFNTMLETPARTIRQDKGMRGVQIGKDARISLFADYLSIYLFIM